MKRGGMAIPGQMLGEIAHGEWPEYRLHGDGSLLTVTGKWAGTYRHVDRDAMGSERFEFVSEGTSPMAIMGFPVVLDYGAEPGSWHIDA